MKINASVSPNSLITQMTVFAYESSHAFQVGQVDAAKTIHAEEIRVGISLDATKSLYDERSIAFRAKRLTAPPDRHRIISPHLFIVKYFEKTHLPGLPEALAPHLSPETKDAYQNCFYGELHEIRGIEYKVEKDGDDIDISRNISYALHGTAGALYEIGEVDESDEKVQWIPLAHEQRSLRIEERIQEEQVDDQIEQLTFNAHFKNFRDGVGNADFYAELVDMRTKEAAICISALVHCLKRGSRIPAYDQLIDTA
jgi:hypothetical protein